MFAKRWDTRSRKTSRDALALTTCPGALCRPERALLDEALPRLGGVGQAAGNLPDIVEHAIGNGHDQLVGFVVGECQPEAVDAVESDHAGQCQSLIAVSQSMVTGE